MSPDANLAPYISGIRKRDHNLDKHTCEGFVCISMDEIDNYTAESCSDEDFGRGFWAFSKERPFGALRFRVLGISRDCKGEFGARY